jgi:uncharacterized membrane protein YgcG
MAGNFPQRVKNALDHRKLNLSAPTPGQQGKYSSLIWGFHANNPRITVWTNVPEDQTEKNGNGKIAANMDTPVFFALMNLLYQAIDAPGEFRRKIENKNFIFPGGKRSEKPVVVSETHVGKDAEGCVYISVTARDRPKIKFVFGSSDFHQFFDGSTGEPLSKAECSVLFAKGYVRLLEGIVEGLAVANYEEPKPKEGSGGYGNRGGGGGGGGRNYGGNSGGGGGNFGDSDDMPF